MKKIIIILSLVIINISFHLCKSYASTYSPPYIIEIPEKVIIDNTNSFVIKITNNLSSSQKLKLSFDKDFVMKDLYGKADVNGQIINDEIEIDNSINEVVVNYSLPELSAGKWSCNLNLNLSLENETISHMLIDGPSLNDFFSSIGTIRNITFSNDPYTSSNYQINGQPYVDISLAQDESVLVYKTNNTSITITSNGGECIYTNENSSYLFNDMSLRKLNNTNILNTSYTTNMAHMFDDCGSITSIDISSFDTSKVEDMSYMFNNCADLETLSGISNFNTSNVTNMSYMFNTCQCLSNLNDVEGFDTSKVEDMSYMFYDFSTMNTDKNGILDLNLSNWDLTNVEDMNHMFSKVVLIKSVTFGDVNTLNLKDMSNMFHLCSRIKSIDMSSFDTDNVTNMSHLFDSCRLLESLPNINSWNVSKVEDMSYILNNDSNIIIDQNNNLSTWTPTSCNNFENALSGSAHSKSGITMP